MFDKLQRLVDMARLNLRLDNLAPKHVKNLMYDIIMLNEAMFKLKIHQNKRNMIDFLCTFVVQFLCKACNSYATEEDSKFSDINDSDEESSYDSESNGNMIVIDSDNEEVDVDYLSKLIVNTSKPIEQKTIKLTEMYVSMFTYQKLIVQLVNMLSSCDEWECDALEHKNETSSLESWINIVVTRLFEKLEQDLAVATAPKLRETVDYLVSVSHSFEYVLDYLNRFNGNSNMNNLWNGWNKIRLIMLCSLTCPSIDGRYISHQLHNFDDNIFDSMIKVKDLLIRLQVEMQKVNKSKIQCEKQLQLLVENYISHFVLNKHTIKTASFDRFVGDLVNVIGSDDVNYSKKTIGINLDELAQFEIMRQMLVFQKEHNYKKINEVLCIAIENSSNLNSFVCTLITRVAEQINYKKHNTINMKDGLNNAANELNQSLTSNSLDQLFAIAKCKVWLFLFVKYMNTHNIRIEENLNDDKIARKEKCYLNSISSIFKIKSTNNSRECKIKNGLQYYFFALIWRLMGMRRALAICSQDLFVKKLHFSMLVNEFGKQAVGNSGKYTNEWIPTDNIFRLLKYDNLIDEFDEKKDNNLDGNVDQKLAIDNQVYTLFAEFGAMLSVGQNLGYSWKNTQISSLFRQQYFVCLVCVVFNCLLLQQHHGQTNVNHDDIKIKQQASSMINFIDKHCLSIVPKGKDNVNRCYKLFQEYLTNHLVKDVTMNPTSNKISFARLETHLFGVLLSLSKNPLSILLYSMMDYENNYLIGMPSDESSLLLKTMAGHGVWVCPNDHIYFIGNCTSTNQSSNCPTCGDPIGNKKGGGCAIAAHKNRRIGRIDKDGNIKADKYGATEGLCKYNPETLSSKGYVWIEGQDKECRNMNGVNIRIIRLIVNLTIVLHCSCNKIKCTDAVKFMGIKKYFSDIDGLIDELKSLSHRYIGEISTKLNIDVDSCMYLMHGIIHTFYINFMRVYGKNGFDFMDGLGIETRKQFEKVEWNVFDLVSLNYVHNIVIDLIFDFISCLCSFWLMIVLILLLRNAIVLFQGY